MHRLTTFLVWPLLLLIAAAPSLPAEPAVDIGSQPAAPPSGAPELLEPVRLPWIDSAQIGLHRAVWRTAMKVDGLFGPVEDGREYARTSGSIAPALLWDEYDNVKPKVRFRVDLPLPQLDQRWSAFIGRVSRDEFVTEREQASGAFPRDFGDITDDQVLAGVKFRPLQNDGRFELDGGVRVRSPLDPYVKGGYRYMRALSPNTRLHLRETLFWQNSDGVGITSRADVDRILLDRWLLRWTGSGTWSQKSAGVRGYSALMLMREFPQRRALAMEVGLNGEFDAPVPLQEYGGRIAWRQSVVRDWLVLEVRTSLTWPRMHLEERREPNWGFGVGLEMFFGTTEFLARPVTF